MDEFLPAESIPIASEPEDGSHFVRAPRPRDPARTIANRPVKEVKVRCDHRSTDRKPAAAIRSGSYGVLFSRSRLCTGSAADLKVFGRPSARWRYQSTRFELLRMIETIAGDLAGRRPNIRILGLVQPALDSRHSSAPCVRLSIRRSPAGQRRAAVTHDRRADGKTRFPRRNSGR